MKRIFTAALAAALLAGAPAMAADWPAGQTVVSGADVVSAYAGADHFTGRVRMENLFPAAGDFQAYGARVTFEPGARTHWHIHPAGQVLVVTDGAGYTQEWGKPAVRLRPGDVVRCPPGVKHWHGAGPKTAMTHIAISETGSAPVVWLEPVEDSEYPKD